MRQPFVSQLARLIGFILILVYCERELNLVPISSKGRLFELGCSSQASQIVDGQNGVRFLSSCYKLTRNVQCVTPGTADKQETSNAQQTECRMQRCKAVLSNKVVLGNKRSAISHSTNSKQNVKLKPKRRSLSPFREQVVKLVSRHRCRKNQVPLESRRKAIHRGSANNHTPLVEQLRVTLEVLQ